MMRWNVVLGVAAACALTTLAGAQDTTLDANPVFEPESPVKTPPAAWEHVTPGLHGAVGSIDVRYSSQLPPDVEGESAWSGSAWRGERVNVQCVLWTAEPVEQVRIETDTRFGSNGLVLPASWVTAQFERYVLADGNIHPDALDPIERLDLNGMTTRPIWVMIDVPAGATPGMYRGAIAVKAKGAEPITFTMSLEVLENVLPAPADWEFYLDLWQNPYAVARYHHVDLWSDAHFDLMRPHLRMLAVAGQKCLTTTILHQAWGLQTYDPYGSMVAWTKNADGSWTFDYTVFDRYVEFASTCGLDGMINCYSMVPWTNQIRYRNAATGDFEIITLKAGDANFIAIWTVFLKNFTEHLRAKGWLERTAIAMDERPLPMMRPTIDLVRAIAPELKIALAGNIELKLKDDIDDWCVKLRDTAHMPPEVLAERTARGRVTTFYVCCNPNRPNTFTASPPAESTWLGYHASAMNFSGLLRWAYDSWTADPLRDTTHVTWTAGDCYLVYPNAQSSIRFELLRDGIEEFEKIRVLRAQAGDRCVKEIKALDAALALFTFERAQTEPAALAVQAGREAVEALSRAVNR
jgi:hypothetical protein